MDNNGWYFLVAILGAALTHWLVKKTGRAAPTSAEDAGPTPEASGGPYPNRALLMLGTAALSGLLTWALVKPDANEAHAIRDYNRVERIANGHERCLKELSGIGRNPTTLNEARSALSRASSRAEDCYRGNW